MTENGVRFNEAYFGGVKLKSYHVNKIIHETEEKKLDKTIPVSSNESLS